MKVVVIEMRKCEGLAGDDPLGLWIRLFRATTTQELDDIERSGVPIMAEAVREMRKIQHEDIQRMVALSYELAEYDEAIVIREAEERGIELGERRGEQRGIELGEERAEQRLIRRMAAGGLSIAQIAAASGYSEEQVAALLEA
jgi:predicted transposase/invertase (TIGR01784 family)